MELGGHSGVKLELVATTERHRRHNESAHAFDVAGRDPARKYFEIASIQRVGFAQAKGIVVGAGFGEDHCPKVKPHAWPSQSAPRFLSSIKKVELLLTT